MKDIETEHTTFIDLTQFETAPEVQAVENPEQVYRSCRNALVEKHLLSDSVRPGMHRNAHGKRVDSTPIPGYILRRKKRAAKFISRGLSQD